MGIERISMVEIIWKDVDGYEGVYQISSAGEVRRIKKCKGAIIGCKKPTVCPSTGYLKVALWEHNKGVTHYIHRLVAIAFVEGDHTLTVNHIDGNKLNNTPSNLEWITKAENTIHQHETGLMNPVAQFKPSKVPLEDYERIIERYDEGEPCDFIASDYGCSQPLISWILRKAKPLPV